MPNYRKLIEKLAELYPTIVGSQLILRYANVPIGGISFNNAAELNWLNIITWAEPRKKLGEILQVVADKTGDTQILEYIKEETSVVLLKDAGKAFHAEIDVDVDVEELKKPLKKLVGKGKLKDVLVKLNDIADDIDSDDYKNAIILLQSRLHRLDREYQAETISREAYNVSTNKIINAINYQIDELESEQEIKTILSSLTPAMPAARTNTGLNVLDRSEFEKVMRGRDDIMPIEWLADAMEKSRIVCKVELSTGGSGTGFLLKGGYVLTNHHVICKHFPQHLTKCDKACVQSPKDCPGRARVLLNYQGSGTAAIYDLDPADTYLFSKELDYALIKVIDDPANPLAQWGHAEFETFKIPAKDDLVNIIQHPEGEQKKIAMPDSVISVWPEKNHLFYLADTKGGSSGSPVFNQDWKVVALHHAGRDQEDGGLPINAAGDKHEANRGILIGSILEDLKSKGIEI